MRYALACLIALLSVLVLPALPGAFSGSGAGSALAAGVEAGGCVTAQCHAILGKARLVHEPVAEGDCAACHKATEQAHPGKGSMQLVEAEPGLCLQCHDDPSAGLEFPHSAVQEGCTGCHSPHQGAEAKLLLQPGGKLCLICHDEVKARKYVHGPVLADNCRICHGVHGGDNEFMLNLPGKEMCFSCHPQIRKTMETAVSRHDPVSNGVCWECHVPHSSDYRPHLKASYTRELYAPFREENFGICFSCHDKNAFLFAQTSEVTDFRNKHQNLHYFHVNRPDKGRTCRNCHGVHGADQEKLLQSRVPDFGSWSVPLTWASEGERATCYVGCHRPKTYDRQNRVKNR